MLAKILGIDVKTKKTIFFKASCLFLVMTGCHEIPIGESSTDVAPKTVTIEPTIESPSVNEPKQTVIPIVAGPDIHEKIFPGLVPIPGSGGGGRRRSSFIGINLTELRTIDGTNNNADDLGMAAGEDFAIASTDFVPTMSSCLMRHMHHYMDDGETPRVNDMPHPRLVSNTIFSQSEAIPSPTNLSQMIFVWGQFLDHDISLAPLSSDTSFSIPPFDDEMTEHGMRFFRSQKITSSGTSASNPRQQFNQITSFIDASQVYGSSDSRARWLRTYENGELKVSEENLLPFGSNDGSSPPMGGLAENPNLTPADLFVAGDARANETLFLNAMHTIFVREHNRLAKELRERSGERDDEKIYEAARKIVGALMQAITFNEFLPALGVELPAYTGYQAHVDPRILNIFAAAAFRFGHTMLSEKLFLKDAQGHSTELDLFEVFFAPSLMNENSLAGIIRGALSHKSERIDNKVVDGVRNFLFDPFGTHGKMDLVMLNIHRGREHGLPHYLDTRAMFDGQSKISPENESLVLSIYSSLDQVDLWVGMLSEPEMPGKAIGQTIHDIFVLQFSSLRDGDRFYYKNDPDFSPSGGLGVLGYDVGYIENRRLGRIITDNTQVSPHEIPTQIFLTTP